MPRTPSAAHPYPHATARFIVRRDRLSVRVGRIALGVVLAAVIALLAWTGIDLADLMQASR